MEAAAASPPGPYKPGSRAGCGTTLGCRPFHAV